MPLYDYRCNHCSRVYVDEVIPLARQHLTTCRACGGDVTFRLNAPVIVGPTDTNPLVVESAGVSFTSKSEIRRYQEANPGFQVMSADSPDFKRHHQRVREKAESKAKSRGFRDFHHQKTSARDEKARREGRSDAKIVVTT